ncbi:MAG: SpoIIE family protein phosphatase, partial [Rhodocyclaceae bacterium]
VLALLQRCHEALLQTRGAAMTLGALDVSSATLTWTGVGNVEAVLIAGGQGPPRGKLCLTNRGGVVGYRLPPVDASSVPIFPGDLLILATDGVDCRFACEPLPRCSPDALAHAILDRHGKASDDALVLVLHWFGQAASAFPRAAR